MYSAFTEVKLGKSEGTILTEPKTLAHSDKEFLFFLDTRRVLGFVVWCWDNKNF